MTEPMYTLYTSPKAIPIRVWEDFSLVKHYKSGGENDI
jgi:hypothetical protein